MAMGARMHQIRRVLAFLAQNQSQNSPFKVVVTKPSTLFLPPANALFNRDDFCKRWIQTQEKPSSQTDEDMENHDTGSLKPACESASITSPVVTTDDSAVKHKVLSNLKTSSRHDLAMIFTCKVCETRSVKTACRESYEKGVVVARCPGCDNLHLIADRLGWFGEPGSIEDFLAARGEEVIRGSTDTLNLTLEELAGKKILKN